MTRAMVSLLMIMLAFSDMSTAQSIVDTPSSTRIEVRVETLANLEGGGAERCEVTQVKNANSSLTFAFWSTVGAAQRADTEPAGKKSASRFSDVPPVAVESGLSLASRRCLPALLF